jgi:CRISPR-associated protein Csm5
VAAQAEADALGGSSADRMRVFSAGDSDDVPASAMKIYLLRVATLKGSGDRYELGWKASPRGSVDGRRPDDSTPSFAEMAPPGTAFTGDWREREFLKQPEITRTLHWKHPDRGHVFELANQFAETVLGAHLRYAETAGLENVAEAVRELQHSLSETRTAGGCLLPLGWGGGFLTKVPYSDTADETYRTLLKELPFYARSLQTGMPFPKTRRIVFLANRPATLPGWVRLEVS